MKRVCVFIGAIVLATLALAPAATAVQPERFFLPAADTVLSGPCAFDVGLEILSNKEFVTVFSDGHFLITGVFKVRLTNLSDPSKSMDVNISGPGAFTPTPDGGLIIEAHGKWLFWFFPGNLGPGSPGMLLLTNGLTTEVFDGNGDIVSFKPARNTTDACAALT